MGDGFAAVAVVAVVDGASTVRGLAHQLAPAIGIVVDIRAVGDAGSNRGNRGGAVKVAVNEAQLVEVVLVGPRAERTARIGAGVGKVIHTAILRTAVFGLVREAVRVRNFLAHHMQPFIGVVIGCRVEVRVVHLRGTLRDMHATGNVDRCQAQPAVVAIFAVTNLRSSRHHPAAPACLARDDGGQ